MIQIRLIDADKLKANSDITNWDKPYGCSFQVIDKQPTVNEWKLIEDNPPPDNVEVLFKKKKDGKKYVGFKRTYCYHDGEKYIKYFCVTARGSTATGMVPIAWMPIPE